MHPFPPPSVSLSLTHTGGHWSGDEGARRIAPASHVRWRQALYRMSQAVYRMRQALHRMRQAMYCMSQAVYRMRQAMYRMSQVYHLRHYAVEKHMLRENSRKTYVNEACDFL